MKDPNVLTTSDVARRLHVTPSTVFRWIKAGWLRSSPTAGRHNRIHEKDLRQFMKERGMWLADETGPMRVVAANSDQGVLSQITSLVRAVSPDAKIEAVANASSAMLKIGALTPHLIILDADMPNMSAWNACQAIRSASKHENVKILVTASGADERRGSLVAAGADLVLNSPFPPEELLAELRRSVPGFLTADLSPANC